MSVEPHEEALPRDPRRLRRVRTALADWLESAGIDGDDRNAVILASHEALANAVEHAQAEGEVRVRAEVGDHAVTVTVTSPGGWKEPVDEPGRGNGLVIMRGLTETAIATDDARSTVRLRRHLRRE